MGLLVSFDKEEDAAKAADLAAGLRRLHEAGFFTETLSYSPLKGLAFLFRSKTTEAVHRIPRAAPKSGKGAYITISGSVFVLAELVRQIIIQAQLPRTDQRPLKPQQEAMPQFIMQACSALFKLPVFEIPTRIKEM